MHTEAFRDAAKTDEAHDIAMSVGKGMAVAGRKIAIVDSSITTLAGSSCNEYFVIQ